MEKQVRLTFNGQSVTKDDIDTVGDSAGLADDRTLANLFALPLYDGTTVSRGILPLGSLQLIVPNGASGSVLVNPFRAFIGSRTAVATDARDNLRGIRSGLSVPEGAATLSTQVSFAANPAGSGPRFDLVYCTVTPDTPSATLFRKVKDVATAVVTAQSVAKALVTTVTISKVQGTPSATPNFPALPADPAGGFNIVLGYVLIPEEFAITDTIGKNDIAIQAPVLSRTSVQPAYAPLTTAEQHQWAAVSRPARFMSPMVAVGATSLLVAVDLTSGRPSHAPGGVVDARDWRGRVCKSHLVVSEGTSGFFPWDAVGTAKKIPSAKSQPFSLVASSNHMAIAMGQTITVDDSLTYSVVCTAANADINALDPFGGITLYCDHADGGKLKVTFNAGTAVGYRFFFWVDFSGVYE